jgi:hypothetical protein
MQVLLPLVTSSVLGWKAEWNSCSIVCHSVRIRPEQLSHTRRYLTEEVSAARRGSVAVSAWTPAVLCDGFHEFLAGADSVVIYTTKDRHALIKGHRVSVRCLNCVWCDSPRPTLTSRNYMHRKPCSNPLLFCANGANKCLSTENGVMIEVTRTQSRTQDIHEKLCQPRNMPPQS